MVSKVVNNCELRRQRDGYFETPSKQPSHDGTMPDFRQDQRSIEDSSLSAIYFLRFLPKHGDWECGETSPVNIQLLWRELFWCGFGKNTAREGRMSFKPPARFGAPSFSIFRRSMMQSDQTPLTDAFSNQRFEGVFEKRHFDFGSDPDAIYTPAITHWALISQALFSGEHRSCKAAVLRVASLFATVGRTVCSVDTGEPSRVSAKSRAIRRVLVSRSCAA